MQVIIRHKKYDPHVSLETLETLELELFRTMDMTMAITLHCTTVSPLPLASALFLPSPPERLPKKTETKDVKDSIKTSAGENIAK